MLDLGPVHAVTAAELLDLWEWGLGRQPVERGLALLAAAWPERPVDELARLPIGRRDAGLLALRSALFGPELQVQTECPQCGERLELAVHSGDLLAAAKTDESSGPEMLQTLEVEGSEIHFRLPSSLDLLEAADAPDPRRRLLQNLVIARKAAGAAEPVSADPAAGELPAEAEAALLARMQGLDPLAGASFALSCPACGQAWVAPFDIVSYLWSEIEAWAYRTLREIHWLASAYGWREADILALGAWRRQAYLQMSGYA